MPFLYGTLLGLLIVAAIIFVSGLVDDVVCCQVYGKLLYDATIEKHLISKEHLLNCYHLNFVDSTILSSCAAGHPYIAEINSSLKSRWRIDGVGQIPTQSKWTKILYQVQADFLLQ